MATHMREIGLSLVWQLLIILGHRKTVKICTYGYKISERTLCFGLLIFCFGSSPHYIDNYTCTDASLYEFLLDPKTFELFHKALISEVLLEASFWVLM